MEKPSPNRLSQKMKLQSHPRLRTPLQPQLPKKNQKKPPIFLEKAKKTDAPQSASQTSTSHFSSVSTPEYRSGWDKIFGKPKIETAIVEPLSKYDQRKALVAEQWHKYQALKDPKHLAVICRELPFFDHPEVGDEIAKLLMDK